MANLEQDVHLQNSDEITKVHTGNGEQLLDFDSDRSRCIQLGDVPQTPPHIIHVEKYLCISPAKDGKELSEEVPENQALGKTFTTATNISDVIKCSVLLPKNLVPVSHKMLKIGITVKDARPTLL